MVDYNRISLRYTASQRNFKLTRYKAVLSRERDRHGICKAESRLCAHSWKTNDPVRFLEYVREKAKVDKLTREFYRQTNGGIGNSECFVSEEVVKTGY